MNDQLVIASSPTLLAVDDNGSKDDISVSITAASSLDGDLVPRFQWSDTYFSNENDIIAVFDLDYPRPDSFKFFFAWIPFFIMPLMIICDSVREGESVCTYSNLFLLLLPFLAQWPGHFRLNAAG
jgi:sulfur carrier protein ThiS